MKSRLLMLMLFTAVSCSAKREAASLVTAVDRFRQADNSRKPELEADVIAVKCSDTDVCAAKDACLKMITPTSKALRMQAEITHDLESVKSGKVAADAAADLPQKLEDAQKLLKDGESALTECDQKTLDLRMKYGL